MRKALLGLVLTISCVNARFQQIAYDAAATSLDCSALYLTPLRSWSFRAAGCGQVTYWRCWYKKHTLGETQCCRRVETESDAIKVFIAALDHPGGPYPETAHCQ